MTEVSVSQVLESYVNVTQDDGDAEVLRALRAAGCRFAMVGSPDDGGGNISVGGLRMLAADGALSVPGSVVVIDAEPNVLEAEILLELTLELARGKTEGAVVLNESSPIGVIAREVLVGAMPLELFTANRQRHGPPDIPALRYRCNKCDPPSIRLLRAAQPGGKPPSCPSDFFHGAMERAAS
jgi:hypothetical protein